MDSKIIYKLLLLVVFFFSTLAHAVEFEGKFIQGHYIIGKTNPGTKIIIDKKKSKSFKGRIFCIWN
jgi:hypothetical protein